MIIPHILLRSVTGFDFVWRARTQTTSEEDNLVQFGGESATWLLVWVHVSNVGGMVEWAAEPAEGLRSA